MKTSCADLDMRDYLGLPPDLKCINAHGCIDPETCRAFGNGRGCADRQTGAELLRCDCADHPDFPERCSPTRGHFNCAGKYIMPRLPDGMVCAHAANMRFGDVSGTVGASGQ